MYLLTLFGCVFNLFFIFVFSRFLNSRLVCRLVIISLFLSLLCSFVVFYEVLILKTPCFLDLSSWVQVGFLNLNWGFIFDSLSVTLLSIVLFVSLLVHLYSLDYMSGDPHLVRFIFSLSLFTFFMLLMIVSNNVLQLFLGWEGVGLSSYLLINFWFGRLEANKSAIKAIVVNRFGDFGLYMALLFLIFGFKTLNFGSIFAMLSLYDGVVFNLFGYNLNLLALISSFVFLGTMGKSAQIGLHMWLPDAMEGPTPVSALLHAATMVTAGVFVLMRFSILVERVPNLLIFISFIGFCTTFFAGLSAVFQYDIKKIIAYSTCSHLGIMLILCGFSHYDVAIFHLFNHAFFKALLFLSAGAIIHSLNDEQDVRKMGGIIFLMPFTYLMFLVGSLSLIGFPFLSGFFSKDRAWELFFARFYDYQTNVFFLNFDFSFLFHKYSFFLFTLIVILSVAYAFRLVFLVFPSFYNGFRTNLFASREASLFMWFPLFVLALFSILAGYVFKDLFLGLGSNVWLLSFARTFFSVDTELLPFQEIFFSNILSWDRFFLRIFTLFISLAFLFFISRFFFSNNVFSVFSSYILYCTMFVRLISTILFFYYKKPAIFLKSSFSFFSMLISVFIFVFYWSFFLFVFYAFAFLFIFIFFKNAPLFYNKWCYRFFHSYINSDHFLYRWFSTLFSYISYHVTFKSIDRGFVEYFGPFGITHLVTRLSTNFSFFFLRSSFFSFLFVIVFSLLFVFLSLFFLNSVCFFKCCIFVLIIYFTILNDNAVTI